MICWLDCPQLLLLSGKASAGRHRELVVLNSDDMDNVRVRHFPIPVAEATNVLTIPGREGVIIVGDGGSKILELDFSTGIIATLYASTPGEAGFRAGAHGSVSEGHLYIWGAFHSATGAAVREGIVEIPLAGGPMVALTSSGEIVSQIPVSALGGSLVAPDSCFFVGRSDSVSIMKLVGDEVVEIDSGDVFHGLWGSRHRVLFILEREDVDSPQVLLHDTLTNTTTPIASGDYSYPVLSGDGSTVVFAEYDYEHGLMTYYLAAEDDGFAMHELLQNVPIGPLRLSLGGKFYAYLSVNGLTVGQVANVIAWC